MTKILSRSNTSPAIPSNDHLSPNIAPFVVVADSDLQSVIGTLDGFVLFRFSHEGEFSQRGDIRFLLPISSNVEGYFFPDASTEWSLLLLLDAPDRWLR